MMDTENKEIEFWDDVLLIMVLYNEDLSESITFNSILSAANYSDLSLDLFVYDNSPEKNEFDSLDVKYSRFNIVYTSDINNNGLSIAYNKGIKHAREKSKKYVLILDQDTEFPIDFFLKYQTSVMDFDKIKIFAPKLLIEEEKIFSPCLYRFKRGWHPKKVDVGVNSLFKFLPVNSGVLIHMDVFDTVGLYNQNLKIDYIDFQFMERVRNVFDEFYVVDVIGKQEFSANAYDYKSELNRFSVFVCDVKNIPKNSLLDSLMYTMNIYFRLSKLSFKYMSFQFIKVYLELMMS